ncbi:MAG: DUF4058 family protein [Gemmataceae bacterium]|nr:DUF4058 family protein [Gemmataceae bacterium]
MPLRDHFRPPLSRQASWEGFHGGWPMVIVQQLRRRLPPGFVAEPRVHSGSQVEIDVSAWGRDDAPPPGRPADAGGGVATAVWAPGRPAVAVETAVPDADEYEVRVYDAERGRTLVAAVEIVSPANKDRPEHRNVFVAKCAALMQKGVAVSIVDLVTVRRFNLYLDLLEFVGQTDETLGEPTPHVYAATCRRVRRDGKTILEAWSHRLAVGDPLPTLPLWLDADRSVPLDLEASYEQACSDLWIA